MAQCSDKRISKRVYKTKIGVKIVNLNRLILGGFLKL